VSIAARALLSPLLYSRTNASSAARTACSSADGVRRLASRGSGKALIEAAEVVRDGGLNLNVVGVDLVGSSHRLDPDITCLRLIEISLSTWIPDRRFDPITRVHGLHYIGDKLGLIGRAASWLADEGLFVASLDLANLRLADGRAAGRVVTSDLRRAGLGYDRRERLVVCRGRRVVNLPYLYLGADDLAGPNSTGQPAVDSYYRPGAAAPTRPV